MPPVFASPDIAALVAAFPPPLPTKDRPSLVKSRSGNSLYDSRKIVTKLRSLLETSAARIRKSDLPARLDIDTSDWLLDCCEHELYYSRDLQSLLPAREVQNVASKIRGYAQDDFVDAGDFAANQDISRQSCDRLLGTMPKLRYFSIFGNRRVVADMAHVDRVKKEIQSELEAANGERVDLTDKHPTTPFDVLHVLARETVEKPESGEWNLLVRDDKTLIYVPHGYEDRQKKKRREAAQASIAAAVNDLATEGFCDVPEGDTEDGLISEIVSSFKQQHEGSQLVTLEQSEKGRQLGLVIATVESLDVAMQELEELIRDAIKARPADHAAPSLHDLERSLLDNTSYHGRANRLLRSNDHRQTLEATILSATKSVEDARSEQFVSSVRNLLLAPLELYCIGLQSVSDQMLNDRLDGYLCQHFRNEIVPDTKRALERLGLLHDKARARDLDRLVSASAEAKTLPDLQAALGKLCRKQKVAMPDASELSSTKRQILLEKLQLLQKMSRGSDVLQNVVWILLAQSSDGLFMSSGKDTSRIIKHYQSVGDPEKGRRLEAWRDALKAGTQTDADVQEMKSMAEAAVRDMYGDAEGEAER